MNFKYILLALLTVSTIACKPQAVQTGECKLDTDLEFDGSGSSQLEKCKTVAKNLDANVTSNIELNEFDQDMENKVQNAIERLLIIINSEEFKKRVLNHEYNGKKAFANNNGLTNEQIYEALLAGSETLQEGHDEEMDMKVTYYYANNGTVGYTYPNTTEVWVNQKFYTTYTYAKIAGNLVHEWCHKLGFKHDSSRTAKREFSVPYGVGYIVRELIDDMTIKKTSKK